MQYVGNDIVAYKHIRCLEKWKNERFLQKILQPFEIEKLQQQVNKDAYLWTIWTLKEAAYKLSCFLGNRNKFHPIQFSVQNIADINDNAVQHINFDKNNIAQSIGNSIVSTVHFEGAIFYGESIITHQFIHSIVCNEQHSEKISTAIGQHNNYNKNDYSKEVRLFAIQELGKKGINFDAIYKDDDGIPFIIQNEKPSYISLSHDQQYVSYAYVSKTS